MRSLMILVVTIAVVATAYFGFSRFAPSRPGTSSASRTGSPAPSQATAESAGGGTPMSAATAASSAEREPPSTAAAAGSPVVTPPSKFQITISSAHPPALSDVIRVEKDDPVTLTITSDRAGHLEVHGYGKEVSVEPGETATLSFQAVRAGRFPIDLHGSDGAHVAVTALEVLPR